MSNKLRFACLLLGALAGACTLRPTLSGERAADHLRETNGRYVLNRRFEDFYDTAFVLTNGGATAPRVVGMAELARILSRYDVVFYGESHMHPGVHRQQMALLRALVAHNPHWVLSLEQFERDVQGVLDDYLAARIGETTFIGASRAWNNYATSYRPLLLFAREHHLPVIAAEAPDWAISCVGRWGTDILDRFSPLEREWVAADLHVTPGAYHDKFAAFLGGSPTHGGGSPATPEARAQAERSYAAQVTRDDTMAESIDRARRRYAGYQVLHLTGSFHSAAFLGTVERLRLRDPTLKIAVIDSVEVEDPAAPAFDADLVRDGTVLQLVYPTPDSFVPGEDMSAWIGKVKHERESAKCKYAPGITAPPAPPTPTAPAAQAPPAAPRR
jgi:uncharacterized iron-regulated protein